jgi:hypothetical protein
MDKKEVLTHIPTDLSMLEKWLEMLFEKGLQSQNSVADVIAVCKLIIAHNKADYKIKNLKKLFEAKMLEGYHKALTSPEDIAVLTRREHKLTAFSIKLIEESFITTTGTINIWKAISDHIDKNPDRTLPLLTSFIKETKSEIKTIEGKKLQTTVIQLRDKIAAQLNHRLLEDYHEDMKEALKYLDDLINTCPTTNLSETAETSNEPKVVKKVERILTVEEEFVLQFKSNEAIDKVKLTTILKELSSDGKEFKNISKIFFESVKHRDDIGKLAKEINAQLKNNHETSEDICFDKTLLNILQNSFKKLPKFDQLSTEEDIESAEFLVRLTGELYNIEWIDQPKLISCMDKLALNSFGSDHQLKMFHNLLQNVEGEMVRQKQAGKCKYYLELLNTTDKNKKVKFLKCVEILQRILKVTKEQDESDDKVEDEFDELLEKMLKETINEVAQKLALMFSTDAAENVLIMLAKFTSKSFENPKLYAKLVKATNSSTFKSLVLDQCQEDFLDSTSSSKVEPKVIDLVEFIGELYNEDLAPERLVNVCMDVLFGVKSPCDVTVDSISLLIRTVRARMESSDKDKLDHYFKYFSYVVDLKEDSYRSIVFEFLIALRNNEWKCDENVAKPLVDHHVNQICEAEVPSISLKLTKLIEDSETIAIVVIRKIWEVVILKPESISLCVNLTNEMSNLELMQEDGTKLKFAELLIQFLTQRHAAFAAIPTEQFSDKIKCRLGQVIIFVAELDQLEIVSDGFMELWLDEKFIKNLNVIHAAQVSAVMSTRTDEILSVELKLKLMILDDKINEAVSKFSELIQKDINELALNI